GGALILAPGWLSSVLLALLLAQILQRLHGLPRERALGLGGLTVLVVAAGQAAFDVTAIVALGPHLLPGGLGVPGFAIAATFDVAILQFRMSLLWNVATFGFYAAALSLLNAERRKLDAEMRALRYELNPHFLFNTLNAISTLILDSQNRTANQAVTRLSDFLRYTLDQDPMKKVTVRQELDALNMYLSTEQLRFGERLHIEFAFEERALEALVPSLLLQPLIENAVKYAVAPREGGGTIRVEGRVRGAMLELVVADDGPGARTSNALIEGRGVGLRNTRERLHVLYGDQHRFAALNAHPGVRIEIALPFEEATSS
ncbi:MAG: histidine kinase, partial [Steroidobacteraceae bacterium]|nr:histidine kinase [Steroidobacteraceae bacterium]